MKLLITREKNQSLSLQKKLKTVGCELFFLPMIQIVPPKDGGISLKAALEQLSTYSWLLLTSVPAVKAVAQYLTHTPKDLKVVVVGPQTFEVARKCGLKPFLPDVSGDTHTLENFFLKQKIQGQRILYPCSSLSSNQLKLSLERSGCLLESVEAYQTLDSSVNCEELGNLLKKGVDMILFFSPSGVQSFFRKTKKENPLLQNVSFVPYGETTAEALKKQGCSCAFIPSPSDSSSFEDQIIHFIKTRV